MVTAVAGNEYLRTLFLNDTPFLDVRAEIEFEKGAFPSAVNAPILTTQERHQVGSCYRQQGQNKAIELGHQLVCGNVRQQRIERWCQFVVENPRAHLCCWRGGLRSNLAREWMQQAGVDIPLIAGGYKALRRVLLEEIAAAAQAPMVIIGGKTGTAKTPLLQALSTGIDLEGWAHHRGSSFGRRVHEPPCQTDFENRLAIDLLKKRHAYPTKLLFLEDESRMVGPLSMPLEFWNGMVAAPIAVVEMPLDFRVERILQEYVVEMCAEHITEYGEAGFESYRQYLLASLFRVRKRLGAERYHQLEAIMSAAIDRQQSSGDVSNHEAWIRALLVDYYDPMYNYQLQKKQQRVVFKGDYQQVLDWAAQQTGTTI